MAPFVATMLERKWLGDKVGQGFYKKAGRDEQGRDLRHVLDWQTLDYMGQVCGRSCRRSRWRRTWRQTGARIAQLLHGDPAKDKAAAFYWPLLTELFTYAANRVPEVADTIVEIDTAMKTGFNWELGPFEMMDAAGVRVTTEKMRAAGAAGGGKHVETLLRVSLMRITEPGPTWYKDDPSTPSGKQYFDVVSGGYRPVEVAAGVSSLAVVKKAKGVVKKNAGASVVDLGDGVAAIELHSKMNAHGRRYRQPDYADAEAGGGAGGGQFEAFVIHGRLG